MEEKLCPRCGQCIIKGMIETPFFRRGIALVWSSDEKVTIDKKTFFTKNKHIEKRLRFRIFDTGCFSEIGSIEGWYCPDCKKVYAEFDVDQ